MGKGGKTDLKIMASKLEKKLKRGMCCPEKQAKNVFQGVGENCVRCCRQLKMKTKIWPLDLAAWKQYALDRNGFSIVLGAKA